MQSKHHFDRETLTDLAKELTKCKALNNTDQACKIVQILLNRPVKTKDDLKESGIAKVVMNLSKTLKDTAAVNLCQDLI